MRPNPAEVALVGYISLFVRKWMVKLLVSMKTFLSARRRYPTSVRPAVRTLKVKLRNRPEDNFAKKIIVAHDNLLIIGMAAHDGKYNNPE